MKRLFVGAVLVALALPGMAHAAVPDLTYACHPEPTDCNAWYRTPVDLVWEWNNTTAKEIGGDCSDRTFTADTKSTRVTCEVEDRNVPGDSARRTATIRLDRTAPKITDPGLGRPPDYGGWFNHRVAFNVVGQDATSGLASCTGGTYSGPDGAGVGVTGSCRDIAGNVASGTFAINYDSTPPPNPDARVLPGKRLVRIRWDSSPYLAEVARVSKAGVRKVLHRGGGERFVDKGLRNGHRYRYVVTLIDQAGNRSSDKNSAVPTSSPLLKPANGVHLDHPPELVWKHVRRASYYNVQLHFAGRKVMTRWPRTTRLQLHERWRSQGRRHHLARGLYCWYVWPGYGPRRRQNYGALLDRSCFRITR